MRSECASALVLMARPPEGGAAPAKTRLSGVIGRAEDRQALYRAFLSDVLRTCRGVSRAALRVAYAPGGDRQAFAVFGVKPEQLLPQRGHDLGARERHVFEDLFGGGFDCVVMIGTDLPTLPAAYIDQAFDELADSRQSVVLGPSEDGGYYLIGLHAPARGAPLPDLFSRIRWSTPLARTDTLAAADRAGLDVRLLPRWYDVDDEKGLRRLVEDLKDAKGAAAAPATAAMLSMLGWQVISSQ